MISALAPSLTWAVHISDGVLTGPWLIGGFLFASLLGLLSLRRLEEDEIPRIALLTAVFFVASSIHVPLGPTRVHLLLNGLLGLLLAGRAALVIPVGLLLQAALIGHGSFSTLGVNSCVLVLPALLAGLLFRGLYALPWMRHPLARTGLIAASACGWLVSLVYSVALLATTGFREADSAPATAILLHPATLGLILLGSGVLVWLENRLEHPPEFALGLLTGSLTVQLTLVLNCLVLTWGGQEDWRTLALAVFLAHLPVAVIEGVVLGFVVSFLARVGPPASGGLFKVHGSADGSSDPRGQPHGPLGVFSVNPHQELNGAVPPDRGEVTEDGAPHSGAPDLHGLDVGDGDFRAPDPQEAAVFPHEQAACRLVAEPILPNPKSHEEQVQKDHQR